MEGFFHSQLALQRGLRPLQRLGGRTTSCPGSASGGGTGTRGPSCEAIGVGVTIVGMAQPMSHVPADCSADPPGEVGPHEDLAWAGGRFLPREALAVPVGDAGFVLGATVTEQLRTFRGRLFLPEAHGERLATSLAAVGIEPPAAVTDLLAAASRVAAHNHARATAAADPAAVDLGVVIFVTPGLLPAQHDGAAGSPWAAVHSFPLALRSWARGYDEGVALRTVTVQQVPPACWPLHAKVRSRLHYVLADREAHAAEPGARAVLAHGDGRISETSTANVVLVRGGRLHAPTAADALPGISLGFTRRLAENRGIPWEERSLRAADLATADEILLTSTPSCVLPVTRFDGQTVGSGRPGPVFRALLDAWSEAAGVDIAGQARAAAAGPSS
jgi:branched-chain amino acid aminotransferase